jgi:hypothetical protein
MDEQVNILDRILTGGQHKVSSGATGVHAARSGYRFSRCFVVAVNHGCCIAQGFGSGNPAATSNASSSAASITGEIVTDRFALHDHALKAHVSAWRDISAALQDAVHSAR